ncbi:MAG TPA: hypothetical protein DCS97_14935 [Planctomycetes bacterium]|nr:hypothetical protein [Planctomycetota bacterium]
METRSRTIGGISHFTSSPTRYAATMATASLHRNPLVLRPDTKGRVGLDSLLRRAREYLGGVPIAGLAAEVSSDGTITLRPRVEVAAETAHVLRLSDKDAAAFSDALAHPPKPNAALRKAAQRWNKTVDSQ